VTQFGQVGLPPGAVVEGEIREPAVVTAALKRLWSESGFKNKDVVLGISSQRAMVRPIDVPAMGQSEMRSALRFQIGELLPIPLDQAVFDFTVLDPGEKGDSGGGGGRAARILVVATQRDIVTDAIDVVSKAGLKVRAVDCSPLALLRAIPPSPSGGLEAVICLGAQLVVVAVRQGTTPRFLRTVAGSTQPAKETALATGASVAEGTSARPRGSAPGPSLEPIVEEVRGSLEYFLSHNQGEALERVLITGGAVLSPRVVDRVRAAVGVPVEVATVGPTADAAQLALTDANLSEASARWATSVGLALWGLGEAPSPTLLPIEVRQRRQFQQALAASGVGLLVVAVGLAGVSLNKAHEVSRVQAQIASDDAAAAVLQTSIDKLQYITTLQQDMAQRRTLAVEALAGDIAWVPLVERIAKALPSYVSVTSLSLAPATAAPAPAGATPAANSADDFVGTLTMSATTTLGPKSVSAVLGKLEAVTGIGAVWVSSVARATGGTSTSTPTKVAGNGAPSSDAKAATSFNVQAVITTKALSQRAANVPGGTK
jgi:type IV pilus assembly protein PilM